MYIMEAVVAQSVEDWAEKRWITLTQAIKT